MVHNTLIVLYSLVIILGIIGNTAILLAFLANKVMLTTRNIFIANLAVSDILLCSVSMPTCLADILTNYWTFGTDFVSFRNSRALFVRSSENSAMMPIVKGCQSLMFY